MIERVVYGKPLGFDKDIWSELRGFMGTSKNSQSTSVMATSTGFSPEELDAMKEHLREKKKAAAGKADGESDVLAKLNEMPEPDRSMGLRLHELIKASAPALSSRTWYGMPAYAKDGKVVCFFQSGQKFKTRYATLGFSDSALLDNGVFWPTSFALRELTPEVEGEIVTLVKRAVG